MKSRNVDKIKDKIVLIKTYSDPGYDFIFNHEIKGLVTQFGGANSHMAIRCLEQNIPAVIGVGKFRYQEIIKSKQLIINCEKTYKINKMKNIGILLRVDQFGKYKEMRDNIDIRFIHLFQRLNFVPILIPTSISNIELFINKMSLENYTFSRRRSFKAGHKKKKRI